MRANDAWGEPFGVYLDSEGWLHVGFDTPQVGLEVKVETVGGLPEIVGLRIKPVGGSREPVGLGVQPIKHRLAGSGSPAVLTSELIHRVPLRQLKALYLNTLPRHFSAGAPTWGATPRGPEPLPRERIAEAADVYRKAIAEGKPVLQAIQNRFGIKRATASKYLRLARQAGLLGFPERRGVPGHTATESPFLPTRARTGRSLR